MKKTTIAYIAGAIAVLVAVALILKPEKSESPVVDVLAPAAAPTAAAAHEIKTGLVGTWESADDSKYTVSFYDDGTVTEKYEGEDNSVPLVDSTGRWLVLVENDTVTLVTSFSEEKAFAYSIIAYDEGRLTLRERDAIRDNHFVKKTP